MNAAAFIRRRARIRHQYHGNRRKRELEHLVRDARCILIVRERRIVGYRLPCGEIVCVKERYSTEAEAQKMMQQINVTNHNDHRVPHRAYQCPACRGWHLTSQQRVSA